jgi:DNA-binding NarL/FixJ family response regulator
MQRIVIIDDHPNARKGFGEMVTQRGGQEFEVVGRAGCVREALPLIKKTQPDMVVVDIALKDKDCIKLFKSMSDMEKVHESAYSYKALLIKGM